MYGIDETTQSGDSGVIPVGINENVILKAAKFEKLSQDKEPVLQYEFEDASGGRLNHVMWNVDEQKAKEYAPAEHKIKNEKMGVEPGDKVTPQHAVQMAYADFNAYNKHILNKIVSNETIIEKTKGATSYADFAKRVVELVDSVDTSQIKLRLKVVPNNKGYSSLPKKHYGGFVEHMSTKPSKLKFNDYEKQLIEQQNANTGDDPASGAVNVEDLDF